jgi:hypothetical protein
VVRNEKARPELLATISRRCRSEFGIFHTTIQLEDERCGDLHHDHHDDHAHEHEHDRGPAHRA